MRTTFTNLFRSLILAGLLFPWAGDGLRAHAADVSPQGGGRGLSVLNIPPSKLCLDDQMTVVINVFGYSPTPTELVIASDNSFSQRRWTILAGEQRVTLTTVFKATKKGGGFADIGFADGSAQAPPWDFKVVECEYSVDFSAFHLEENDKIRIEIGTVGTGAFTTSDGVWGQGSYEVWVAPEFYLTDDTGLSCKVTEDADGSGTFEVGGSKNDDTLTLDIRLVPLFLETAKVECKDANDREGALSFLPSGTVDPNPDLNLTGLTFPPGVTSKRFSFGSSGHGHIEIRRNTKP